ncbi:hypothetical protein K438DRAFT_1954161 [Mycena galopus ATCC 62051]|nr:hypothetical protein K438DRAFT_1954161 [Mycena galopus ATCC 62051]
MDSMGDTELALDIHVSHIRLSRGTHEKLEHLLYIYLSHLALYCANLHQLLLQQLFPPYCDTSWLSTPSFHIIGPEAASHHTHLPPTHSQYDTEAQQVNERGTPPHVRPSSSLYRTVYSPSTSLAQPVLDIGDVDAALEKIRKRSVRSAAHPSACNAVLCLFSACVQPIEHQPQPRPRRTAARLLAAACGVAVSAPLTFVQPTAYCIPREGKAMALRAACRRRPCSPASAFPYHLLAAAVPLAPHRPTTLLARAPSRDATTLHHTPALERTTFPVRHRVAGVAKDSESAPAHLADGNEELGVSESADGGREAQGPPFAGGSFENVDEIEGGGRDAQLENPLLHPHLAHPEPTNAHPSHPHLPHPGPTYPEAETAVPHRRAVNIVHPARTRPTRAHPLLPRPHPRQKIRQRGCGGYTTNPIGYRVTALCIPRLRAPAPTPDPDVEGTADMEPSSIAHRIVPYTRTASPR